MWQIGYAPFVDPDYAASLNVRTSTMRWLGSLADPLQADTLVAVEDVNPLSASGKGAGEGVRIVGWTSYGVNRSDLGFETGEVYGLYVDPDFWGAGIGGELLTDATRALAEAGFVRAVMWALAEDRLARDFYEARGWTFDGLSQAHESGAEVVRYSLPLREAR
jgi:GNAT superfamily N-acetyltransferase